MGMGEEDGRLSSSSIFWEYQLYHYYVAWNQTSIKSKEVTQFVIKYELSITLLQSCSVLLCRFDVIPPSSQYLALHSDVGNLFQISPTSVLQNRNQKRNRYEFVLLGKKNRYLLQYTFEIFISNVIKDL